MQREPFTRHRDAAICLLQRAIQQGGTVYMTSLPLVEDGWAPQEVRTEMQRVCDEMGWAFKMDLREGELFDAPAWVCEVRTSG